LLAGRQIRLFFAAADEKQAVLLSHLRFACIGHLLSSNSNVCHGPKVSSGPAFGSLCPLCFARFRNGRARKEDFTVEEGGIPQKIVHFSDDPDAPVSIGVLIDVTGSMATMPGGAESDVVAASGITRILLHRLKPDDEILLMTFRKNVVVQQGFTKDHARIENALCTHLFHSTG